MRYFTSQHYSLAVLGISSMMLLAALITKPDVAGRNAFAEVADSELESSFAPAAGGNDHRRDADKPKGFSLLQKMRD